MINLDDVQKYEHLCAYFLYQYLKKECVVLIRNIPSLTNIIFLSYQLKNISNIDFTILIHFDRIKSFKFLDLVKQKTDKTLSILSYHNKYSYNNVNSMFHLDCYSNYNITDSCIGWMMCDKLCVPKQKFDRLQILLTTIHRTKSKNDKIKLILLQCLKLQESSDIDIIIRGIVDGKYDDLDKNYIFTKSLQLDKYTDKYDEFGRTNVYIITNKTIQYHELIELVMCGVVIVAPKNYLNKKIVEELNIIEFDKIIPWNDIFVQMNIAQTRDSLMKYCYNQKCNDLFRQLILPKKRTIVKKVNRMRPKLKFNKKRDDKIKNRQKYLDMTQKKTKKDTTRIVKRNAKKKKVRHILQSTIMGKKNLIYH